MAKLFDIEERILPTWRAAARFLDKEPGRTAANVVLEIRNPLAVTVEDRQVMDMIDTVRPDLPLRTVAGTIFPQGMYKRHGRPTFYKEFLTLLDIGYKRGTWGTYAERMMRRQSKSGEEINPLEMLVSRLSDAGQPKKGEKITSFASSYELGITDPEQDLSFLADVGGDIPTYDAAQDGRRWLGGPCLSHLSFKRLPERDGHAVHLTAIYRSHHYCERGLGNLIGLAQLLLFVATEAKLKPGTLTCVSTHAVLDVAAWGGVDAAHKILA